MAFKLVGFFVCALFVVGVAKGIYGMIQGTDTPETIPYRINQEFNGVGLTVDPYGGQPVQNPDSDFADRYGR